MVFKPREVARNVYECRQQAAKTQIAGEVQVCLQVRKSTWDRLREGDTQSIITYDLALDPGRPHPRAVFEETKNNTRRQTQTLGLSRKCEHLTLWLPVSRGWPHAWVLQAWGGLGNLRRPDQRPPTPSLRIAWRTQ